MLSPRGAMPALIVLVLLRQLRVMPAPALFREQHASTTGPHTCTHQDNDACIPHPVSRETAVPRSLVMERR